MRLTDDQLAQFDRDGFLLFPDLFSAEEIRDTAGRRNEACDRRGRPHLPRTHRRCAETIFRVHETDGADALRSLPRSLADAAAARARDAGARRRGPLHLPLEDATRRSRSRARCGSGTRTTATGDWDGMPATDNMATFMVSFDHATELERLPLPRARDTQARTTRSRTPTRRRPRTSSGRSRRSA